MSTGLSVIALAELGVLRARGADVLTFLQGQLSCDLSRLTAEHSLLGAYHNPQGRVVALLRLIRLADDDVALVLPRELVASVAQRLARFVLRSKVRLSDDSPAWQLHGLVGEDSAAGSDLLPAVANACAPLASARAVRVAPTPARYLVLAAAGSLPAALAALPQLPATHWRRLAVADGEPQVYAATSEEFVAQMLNLDLLGAIAFDKGCYTGQEVIARAHYRGRVKRRLQRFAAQSAPPAPGTALALADSRSAKVVLAAEVAPGECEFLAVTTLAGEPTENAARPEAVTALAVRALPLPYALPA